MRADEHNGEQMSGAGIVLGKMSRMQAEPGSQEMPSAEHWPCTQNSPVVNKRGPCNAPSTSLVHSLKTPCEQSDESAHVELSGKQTPLLPLADVIGESVVRRHKSGDGQGSGLPLSGTTQPVRQAPADVHTPSHGRLTPGPQRGTQIEPPTACVSP